MGGHFLGDLSGGMDRCHVLCPGGRRAKNGTLYDNTISYHLYLIVGLTLVLELGILCLSYRGNEENSHRISSSYDSQLSFRLAHFS